MIDEAIYKSLISHFPTKTFSYAEGMNSTGEYYVLKIVDANEDNAEQVFCDNGNVGELFIQIDGINSTPISARTELENIKEYIRGLKSVSDGVNTYQIEKNNTNGVKVIEDNALNTWLALFESILIWRRL